MDILPSKLFDSSNLLLESCLGTGMKFLQALVLLEKEILRGLLSNLP